MTTGQRTRRFLNDLPTWAQAGLVFGVVALLSLLYPTGARLDYLYEQGRTWLYDDLVAPFTFPVLKAGATLESERERLLAEADPYFLYDADVEDRAVVAFERAFASRVGALVDDDGFADLRRRPDRYREAATGVLRRAYELGIAEAGTPYDEPPNGLLRVVRGGEIRALTPDQLRDSPRAERWVADTLASIRLRDLASLQALVLESIRANVTYSDSLTDRFAAEAVASLPTADDVVERGELIVSAGDVITDETVRKLDSYRAAYEEQVDGGGERSAVVRLGYLLITGLTLGTLLLYIRIFHPGEFSRFNRLMFVLSLILVACFGVARIDALPRVSPLVFPFAAVPIIVRSFYPPGVALFAHLVVVLLATFLTGLGYEFAFVQLIAGLVAVLSPSGLRDWSKIARSLALITAAYVVAFFGVELVDAGRFAAVDWSELQWLAAGTFLTLLAYPLVPLLARLFGFTSEVDLLQLADLSRPALRQLAARAPGTMQHSLAVANLAEAAAREIGADALLVRAAALYHDIGKTTYPEYFIENQGGRSPHEVLAPEDSARYIVDHVARGLGLGREAGLPASILSFIASHHGTTRVEYFYRAAVDERGEDQVDETSFRYPGPRPRTREEGILMLADSVEAASRSLHDPTPDELDELVAGIAEGKLRGGQLDACALTLAEVARVRAALRESLRGAYHARIAYPAAETSDAPTGG